MMNKWPPDRVPRTFFAEEQFVARARELRSVIDRASVPVSNAAISPPTGAPVGSASPAHEAFGSASPAHEAFGERRPASDATWSPLRDGDELFSAPDEVRSIRFTVTVPDDWSMHGETTPFLALRFGHGGPNPGLPSFLTPATVPEAMVTIDGEPWHGLDGNHRLVSLPPALSHPGSTCTVTLKAWSGNGPAPSQSPMVWSCPRLVQIDRDVEGFAYDLEACAATVRALPPTELHRALFIEVGLHAIGLVDWNHPGSPDFRASVRAARQAFAERRPRVPAVSADMVPMVSHVGHTHLDVAWLWTTEQVKGKTARSWASALRLMDEFPTFRWLQSQPQLYAYIRETEPHLWTQVKARVADGRWEPEGGMWVEADCNLPSGESLVRQFVYGTRFFRQEFGRECTLLWLPDVFGYSWALPQIMAKCGIRWFMTTKLSWSQFNRFPYDTFQWRGIDGTEVLTHFVTTPDPGQDLGRTWTATYNGQILPDTVKGNWDAYQQKDLNPNTLSSFGWGDGGGGPTRDDMEHASRLADMPGIPRVQIESAQDFFARLEARVGTDPRTPVWDGELYFEYHRGTYTSQANQKRWNRRAEGALQEAELFATIAWCQSEYAYPRHELDAAWEIVLRNQFHDIIPGSSIRAVYEDSAREYAQAFALIRRVRDEAIGAVLAAHSLERASAADATAIIVTNATGFARAELVACPDVPAGLVPALPDGRPVPHQYDSDGTLLAWLPDVPASGLRRFQLVARRSFEGVEAPRVLGAHHAVPETSDTALHLADQDLSLIHI